LDGGTMRIAVLAYDGCMGAEVFGLADTLLIANRISTLRRPTEPPPFACSIVAAGRTQVTLAGGAVLQPAARAAADLLVVPAFDFSSAREIDAIVARLAPEIAMIRAAAGGHAVASICGGAFLLAEAGLLDGRRATTAWAMAEIFMRRYPATRLDPRAMLVNDGDITTSGAFTAYADLALAIIRDQAGAEIARAVARFSLVGAARTSQAPFIDRNLTRRPDPFGREVERWLAAHLAERYRLDRAAAAFGMSARTFLRRVRETTGQSPLELLQQVRLDQARRWLESTDLAIAEIAVRVGYRDVPSFHRLFRRKVAMTPAAYRRAFRQQGAIG
jgi:transcriptional regulator GlxA family with amidase domain